jgi:hypothetical protein
MLYQPGFYEEAKQIFLHGEFSDIDSTNFVAFATGINDFHHNKHWQDNPYANGTSFHSAWHRAYTHELEVLRFGYP